MIFTSLGSNFGAIQRRYMSVEEDFFGFRYVAKALRLIHGDDTYAWLVRKVVNLPRIF